jgi:sirohydrochlorin ferrochelatase
MDTRFRSATLILAIHGSTEDKQPAIAGNGLAELIRSKGIFGEVKAAFHKHAPLLVDSLTQSKGNLVIILPMLMSRGYFAEKVFPEAFQLKPPIPANFPSVHTFKTKKVIYAHPIGLHPGMENLVIESANRVLSQHPFPFKIPLPKASIALIGHGTPRHSKSRESVEKLAEKLTSNTELCQEVRTFFIEEEPAVQEIYKWDTPSKNIVVIPFMQADGPHAAQDIPLALGQKEKEIQQSLEQGTATWRNPTERKGKRIWISTPVGLSPLLPDLILDYITNEIPNVLID